MLPLSVIEKNADANVIEKKFNPLPDKVACHGNPVGVVEAKPRLLVESGAGGGNRTPVISLEGWSSTIELHPLDDNFNG